MPVRIPGAVFPLAPSEPCSNELSVSPLAETLDRLNRLDLPRMHGRRRELRKRRGVDQILGAPGRQLVPNQRRATNATNAHVTEVRLYMVDERVVERDAGDRREQVDASRRQTKLVDVPRGREVARGDAMRGERRAERRERANDTSGIRRVRANEHVEIARGARDSMRRKGMRAHDDELAAFPR